MNFISKIICREFIVLGICLYAQSSFAREYFVITGKQEVWGELESIRNILKNKFLVPEELIEIKLTSNKCKPEKSSIMHLCFNQELEILYLNKALLKRAFSHWQWDEL